MEIEILNRVIRFFLSEVEGLPLHTKNGCGRILLFAKRRVRARNAGQDRFSSRIICDRVRRKEAREKQVERGRGEREKREGCRARCT